MSTIDLQSEVEFLSSIIDHLPSDLVVFDLNQCYLYINPKGVRDTELRKWLLGKTDFDYAEHKGLPNALFESRRARFNQCKKEGVQIFWEEATVTADGRKEVLSRRFIPIIEYGVVKYIVGIGIDITEFRELEEEVSRSYVELTEVLKHAASAIIKYDAHGVVLDWNRAAKSLFEIGCGDAVGKNLLDVLHFKTKIHHLDLWPSRLANFWVTSQLPLEHEIYAADGKTIVHVEIYVRHYVVDDERFFIAFINNISERKKSVDTIRQLASFPEENPNIILRIDFAGDLKYMNPAADQYFKNRDSILFEDFLQVLRQLTPQILAGGVVVSCEHPLGAEYYRFTISPNMEFGYLNVYGHEITDKKNTEDKLLLTNEQLNQRIEEKTKSLKESMNNLEQFAYSISHDLKAPLRHIHSFAQIIEKKLARQDFGNVKELIAEIQIACVKMENQMDGLLDFSKYQSVPLNKEEVDLMPLIERSVFLYQSYYEVGDIEVRYQVGHTVFSDKTLIGIVIDNVVSNAIKYSKSREKIMLHIETRKRRERLYVIIKDNGIGFDPSLKKNLFKIFRRLHNGDEYPGSGIGLSICDRILTRLDGGIRLSSVLDRGTTVIFTQPSRSKD